MCGDTEKIKKAINFFIIQVICVRLSKIILQNLNFVKLDHFFPVVRIVFFLKSKRICLEK